jgi:hypothetical protein
VGEPCLSGNGLFSVADISGQLYDLVKEMGERGNEKNEENGKGMKEEKMRNK